MAYQISSTTIVTDGQIIQNVGIITATEIYGKGTIPAGTVMIFTDASAPTGWTKQTTHNNKSLRVVNGPGGSFGGNIGFTTCCTNYSLSFTGDTDDTTLTVPQIASHNHPQSSAYGPGTRNNQPGGLRDYVPALDTTGGSGAHAHPLTISGSYPVDLSINYIDAIICSRDV